MLEILLEILQSIESIESIAIIIGVIIGAISAVVTVWAYLSENKHRQAERLHQKTDRLVGLRKRYWELLFTKVGESGEFLMDWLPHGEDDTNPARIPSVHRQHLLGFFKEVGILVREGAVDKVHAFYLFAYFAMRCEENGPFWEGANPKEGIDPDTIFWHPFFEFVEEMREIEMAEEAKRALAGQG